MKWLDENTPFGSHVPSPVPPVFWYIDIWSIFLWGFNIARETEVWHPMRIVYDDKHILLDLSRHRQAVW